MSKNAKILRTKFRKFEKISKNGHILILWLYFVLRYFAGFLHFHFEIRENLQPDEDPDKVITQVSLGVSWILAEWRKESRGM